jgi:transcriptional regulator with XRE-family HTH domain
MLRNVERRTVVSILRALRRRRGWSQRSLAARLGISKSRMSRWETGTLDGCSISQVEAWATVLNARIVVDLRVDGERPLTDARHASLQEWLVASLRASGWLAEAEVSFNHFGDRGRVDVLAYHPALRILLVIEIKTRVDDVQDVLGRLDVKRRVGPNLAADRGWTAGTVIPGLVVLEGRTARRRIAYHASLFGTFNVRGRSAIAWLKAPTQPAPRGILAFVSLPG